MTRHAVTCLTLATLLAGASCTGQERICAADQQLCSNACTSPQSDPRNCGACGNVCGGGQGCSAGSCVACAAAPGVCTTSVLAACFNLDQVRPLGADLLPSGPPVATDSGPIHFAPADGTTYLANDLSSSISTITFSPLAVTTGAAAFAVPSTAGADLTSVAFHGGYLFASNAAANTLVILDPATGQRIDEITLPAGAYTNPQGIDFVGNKAYLALTGLDAVAVLDVSRISAIAQPPATIDLSSLAPPGGNAMPSQVVSYGTNRVFVSLNGLDASWQPVPGAHGRLAVIDPASDTLVGPGIDLGAGCVNPSGMAISGTTLWVACGFHAWDSAQVTGGALVPVELSSGTPVAGTPITLGENAVGSVAFCDGHGYAGATESGTVLAFDPVARSVSSKVVACPAAPGKASYVADVACAP